MNTPDIAIVYSKSAFDPLELEQLKSELETYDLALASAQRSGFSNASLDFFLPFVQVILSPEIISNICCGIAGAAIYDGILNLLKCIYYKFHNKPVAKIQGGKMTEEPANIHFVVGNNFFVLPITVNERMFEYAISEFLKMSAETASSERTYMFFDDSKNNIYAKTQEEIINEEIANARKELI